MGEYRNLKICINNLIGLKSWGLHAGKNVGTTFSLSFGKRASKKFEIKKKSGKNWKYSGYTGEGNILIWCDWRLESNGKPIIGSEHKYPEVVARVLKKYLVGKRVKSYKLTFPGYDLILNLTDNVRLLIFCSVIGKDSIIGTNWELCWKERSFRINFDGKCEIDKSGQLGTKYDFNKQ